MKLAEALLLKSDYQRDIYELKTKIMHCSKIQEGEESLVNPDDLLSKLDEVFNKLELITKRINYTNSQIMINGQTLVDLILTRDAIKMKRKILTTLLDEATIKQDRYSQSEIKFVTIIDVLNIQRQIDDLSKRFRELDTQIQQLNWTHDLM